MRSTFEAAARTTTDTLSEARQSPATPPAPAKSAHSLSIVIPALNEEGNIQGTLNAVVAAASQHGIDYEIIVVDDGSTDRTPEIVTRNLSGDARMRLVSHERPWGFGASYHDGRRYASKAYTIMVHGDNAFDAGTLSNFFAHIGKADVICGYISNPASRSRTRRVISALYTAAMNLLFGMRLKYFNGLQIHRTDWLRNALISSDGFGFQAELLVRAIKDGKTYLELGTIHHERRGGGETKIFKARNIRSVVRTVAGLFAWNLRRALTGGPR